MDCSKGKGKSCSTTWFVVSILGCDLQSCSDLPADKLFNLLNIYLNVLNIDSLVIIITAPGLNKATADITVRKIYLSN